jgi:hypothetical protein
MNIENKTIHTMSKQVKSDPAFGHGLYMKGHPGGVTLFAFNGKALYRQTIA